MIMTAILTDPIYTYILLHTNLHKYSVTKAFPVYYTCEFHLMLTNDCPVIVPIRKKKFVSSSAWRFFFHKTIFFFF